MNRFISLLLTLVLVVSLVAIFSSCNKKDNTGTDAGIDNTTENTETDIDNTDIADTDDIDDEDDGIAPNAPGSSTFYTRTSIETDGEPEFTDGKLIIHLAEAVPESETSSCSIGLCQKYSAETIDASFDFDAMAEFKTDDGYTTVVIIPDTEIEPGSYEFYVSFGAKIVKKFTLAVE